MPEIVYVEANGMEHRIEVPVGTTIMQGAVNHAVPGIEGDCGGLCACGTCHVHVPESHQAIAGEAEELEQAMLAFAFEVDERSRLSCQIVVSADMAGMRVLMPERQY
ncbi:MAG: 2Fe-2S iron-sulfur cluster-binding protein [Gammaproteobacteria bacterium]|nr:2Fe-2S iron-sulfur cluster-binding protein [Gammaproteobacteria bacterium]